MKPFDYFAPTSLEEAFDIFQQHPGAQVLAGGTDLLVQAKERGRPIRALVSLRRIPGLDAVTENGVLSAG
ncbi:MAG: xanthine dehydrogenase family protein subunit M, partial [Chloroflexi bacterium]